MKMVNEQFSVDEVGEPLFHQRRNDEVWYYTYDSLSFELGETPLLYTNE